MPTIDRGGTHPRAAARLKIFRPGEMERGGATTRVHLLNISTGGALLYAETAPAVGAEIRLTSGIALGPARVQWSSGRRFGVAFRTPLTPGQLAAMLQAGSEARS
ncbi:PilZ domain-containing protein [Sphingomonas naasensis]|nr:PilZ domain-containing protein [Sphingomonas naasensis]